MGVAKANSGDQYSAVIGVPGPHFSKFPGLRHRNPSAFNESCGTSLREVP
jgi:hypothetical protein